MPAGVSTRAAGGSTDDAEQKAESEHNDRTGPRRSGGGDDCENHEDRSLCEQHERQHSPVAIRALHPPGSGCHDVHVRGGPLLLARRRPHRAIGAVCRRHDRTASERYCRRRTDLGRSRRRLGVEARESGATASQRSSRSSRAASGSGATPTARICNLAMVAMRGAVTFLVGVRYG